MAKKKKRDFWDDVDEEVEVPAKKRGRQGKERLGEEMKMTADFIRRGTCL